MKILVVEDDRSVAQTLEFLVSSYNYAVDVAEDGKAGLQMAEAFEYDLVLLDVMLPKLDGISVCQQLRAKRLQMPILLLTGQGEGHQKAVALNAGADDYVVKPFDSEELMARVQALLRRGQSRQPILTWGNLAFDPNHRRVTYGTHLLALTPKEYAILELFLRNSQTVFSPRAILDHAWAATDSPGEEAVRGHIKELRQKLVAVGASKDWIKTVYRVGYQLNPLYSSVLADEVTQQPTVPLVAELAAVNEQLRVALEQLQSTEAELYQKNQALETAYQTIEKKQQQLQVSHHELEQRIAVRTFELVNANQSLQQQHDQWQALFENALDAILIADDEGRYIDANPAACELFGVSKEELLRCSVADFADPTLEVSQVWQQFLQQGQMTGEFRLFRPDSTTRDTEFNAISNFVPGRHLSVLRNISDRKQAETLIQEQAALLDIASDAIFVRDLDHHILYWNQGAERLYGWTKAEAMGQKATELLQENAAQISEIMQAIQSRDEWRGELHKVTKTGKDVTVEGHWTLVRDETGQPKFILTVNTDITDKKSLEAQFYQAQRLESLGTLASGIAHDLNNVLTPVLAIAQLLRRTATDPERQSQMLQALEDSAKRGANLVQQILTFARGSEGNRIPVQMTDLLQEVVTVVRQTFPKSITIHTDLPSSGIGLISADPTQLHQVLMNLCVNARDAMPEGGVLTLAVQNCSVDERFTQLSLDAKVGDYVLVSVTDTGTGISPEVRDRMFDPFFTTKAVGQGTGLGLSTVLGIVRSHGGFVHVSSDVGHGTQFRVYLPMTHALPSDRPSSDTTLQGNGELILIVDDDLVVQSTSQSVFESYQYQTLVASDGFAAISLYAQHRHDIQVVLIDVMMPNMDGISAIRTLQRMNPAVKIIAMSGLSSIRDAVLAAGATVFLPKPYALEDLLRAVYALIHEQHPDA